MGMLPWPKDEPVDFNRVESFHGGQRCETFAVSRQELEDALGFRVVPGKGMQAFDAVRRTVTPALNDYNRVYSMDILHGGQVKTYSGKHANSYKEFDERDAQEIPFFRTARGPLKYHFIDGDYNRTREEDPSPSRNQSVSPTGLRMETGIYVKNFSRYAYLAGRNFDQSWPRIALNIDTDYANEQEMPLSVNLRSLQMESPKTKEQALEVVRIVGSKALDIQAGKTVSFDSLREEIAQRTGLQKYDEMYSYFDNGVERAKFSKSWSNSELSDNRRKISGGSAPHHALDANLTQPV